MDCSLPGSSVHGISRQEYWNGLPFPSPGDPSDPGIKPRSPTLQAVSSIAGRFLTDWATRESYCLPKSFMSFLVTCWPRKTPCKARLNATTYFHFMRHTAEREVLQRKGKTTTCHGLKISQLALSTMPGRLLIYNSNVGMFIFRMLIILGKTLTVLSAIWAKGYHNPLRGRKMIKA